MLKEINDIQNNKIILKPLPYNGLPFTQSIVTYGTKDHIELTNKRRHFHERIEIHYILKGHGNSIIDNVTYKSSPGDILFINSNIFHVNETTDEDLLSFRFMVDYNYLNELHIDLNKISIEPYIRDDVAQAIFQKMYSEASVQNKSMYYDAVCLSGLLELIVYLCQNHRREAIGNISNPSENSKVKMARSAIKIMENNFSNQISLEDVAQNLGYSQYYFSHAFKEVVGCTAVHYLNMIRCSYATGLLIEGKHSISEIAEKCGYQNLSYFSQTYKKIVGTNPSERKQKNDK